MSGATTGYVNFNTPIHYIEQSIPTNLYSCPTGTYGNLPWIKVTVQAFQNPDTYSGMIYFDMNSP